MDKICISVGHGANSKIWKNKKITWEDFLEKFLTPTRTSETVLEYNSASKDDRSKIKDNAAYVGGFLRGGRRNPNSVVYRQLITLDIDFAHENIWDDFTTLFDCSAILHTTHSHTEQSPRYRLIIPIDREVAPEEYLAICRKVAGIIGIELFDNTTFQTSRLMYFPSCSIDAEYYVKTVTSQPINADSILAMYVDWKDTTEWPTTKNLSEKINKEKDQENPLDKKGIVGIFCRAFSITEALELLDGAYTEGTDGRYTFSGGSTSSGLVIYDDVYCFSHHNTDPIAGRLCNAFDLVRIHKFGHEDEKKSFASMEEFCLGLDSIKKQIATENIALAKYDFGDGDFVEVLDEDDISWMQNLEADKSGNYLQTAGNIDMILRNDTRLKNKFRNDDFSNKRVIFPGIPWRKVSDKEPMKNVDYSGLRNYIESIYGIVSSFKIEDSLTIECDRNSYHPIRDYLLGVKWDGEKRVENLLIDYFGAADNAYSREAILVPLVGAVSRVFEPGCKFDLVLTIVSEQGSYKSTFLKKLGKEWYSDTFMTVQGKEALEQVQGAWIIEMAELSGISKAEVEAVKHFITKQEDSFRPAYARVSETYKRQCVFFGTTNKRDFLKDPSGNRRFLPVDANVSVAKKSVSDLTEQEVDQVWAEAYQLYISGHPRFLSKEADYIAKLEQNIHSEMDDRTGLIHEFLEMKVPDNWEALSLEERRMYIDGREFSGKVRDKIPVAAVWCECLNKNKEDMSRYNTRDINDILRSLSDWEFCQTTSRFKIYGLQKYYRRKLW